MVDMNPGPYGVVNTVEDRFAHTSHLCRTAPVYNVALKSAGYDYDIEYQDTLPTRQRKKTRSRKIIWYNPPFSKNVRTNIGAHFLKLISKHFPEGNKLHKIFNKNTLKVSYSCMRNIQQIIKSHNTDVMKRANQEPKQKTCNCRQPINCPLRGNCLASDVIYKATVTSDSTDTSYIGLASGQFKTR